MADIDVAARPAAEQSASPVVETASGRIAGTTAGGVHAFKGIPYGASTAGANRFLPTQPPQPWTGVRAATAYAGRSPQAGMFAQRPELATVWGPLDTLPVGEDCLTLHVWTPGLDGAKRPIMVWLHGGAFSFGSANSPRYDGSRLALRNDVVVVAVNHRLNIFGHLDLGQLGDARFAHSGNCGLLDLVAALEWVRVHADRFGGDAGNVTIFGQSGGGGKVSALLAMPSAKGLFHKAIVQSGAAIRFAERERTAELAGAVLKQLGLGRGQIDRLQALPVEQLVAAVEAQKTLPPPRWPLLDRYNFGPVIDGELLPAHPFDPAAPAFSNDIPILVGDTRDESAIFFAADDRVWNRAITEEELRQRVAAVAGEATDALLACYARRDPARRADRPAGRGAQRLELRRADAAAGRAHGGARHGAGVAVPLRLADAGVRRPAEGLPFGRGAVRVRHAGRDRQGARQAGRPGAGRPRVADLGCLRAHRKSQRRRAAGLACLRARAAGDHAAGRRLPGRERPRRRGAAAVDQGRHRLMRRKVKGTSKGG